MAINASTPTRVKTSSITNPTSDADNHTLVLGQVKESIEVGQRLRGDPGDSFVRVNELMSSLGARLVNNTIQPPIPGAAVAVAVADSITGTGVGVAPLMLVGDSAAPGNTMLYGTNGSGVKGWYTQPSTASSLAVTDGTHNVTGVTALTFAGMVVSGTTPNATATINASVSDSITGTGASGTPLLLVGDAASPGNNMLYGTNGSGVKGWYAQPSTVSVSDSITGTGASGSPLLLVGDSASPGNNMLYGTNGSGVKGWYTQPSGGGTPASPNTSIQFNNSGAFGGSANLEWNGASVVISTTTSNAALAITTPASNNGNLMTAAQTGVSGTWEVYLPNGTGDLRFFNNLSGDVVAMQNNGSVILNALNSATFGAGYAGTVGLLINNASSTMQTVIDFGKAGVLSGRVRCDFQGGLSLVSTSSTAGNGVTLWVGGDSGVGTPRLDASGTTSAPLVQIIGGGSGATSVFSSAGRATLQLNGSVDSLIDLAINGASSGYIYATSVELRLNALGGGSSPITFFNNNVIHWSMGSSGSMFAASATDPAVAGTLNVLGLQVGGNPVYSGVPPNVQNASYSFVAADNGKEVVHNTATGGHTYTIPVSTFPLGATITIINPTGGGALSIAVAGGVSLQFYPSGGTGTRTMAANSQAVITQWASNTWSIVGVNVT